MVESDGVRVAPSQDMITPERFPLSGLLAPVLLALLCLPQHAVAQQQPPSAAAGSPQNQPPSVQRAEADVERNVKRWRVGVQGGVGLDPEILDVGVHAEFGPIFHRNVEFRLVFELGPEKSPRLLGSIWTFCICSGCHDDTRWPPYVGAGLNFGLSHRSLMWMMTTRSSITTRTTISLGSILATPISMAV